MVTRRMVSVDAPGLLFQIAERSKFELAFDTCNERLEQKGLTRVNGVPVQTKGGGTPSQRECYFRFDDNYEDWTLYLEYDGEEVELPFYLARILPDDEFDWWGIEFYNLHRNWTSDKEYKLRIEETPRVRQGPSPARSTSVTVRRNLEQL